MSAEETNRDEATTLGLSALAWTVSDAPRADRLLALTGLTPEDLRSRVGDPALLAAVLRFLEAHEPDLLACAKVLGVSAVELVGARQSLES